MQNLNTSSKNAKSINTGTPYHKCVSHISTINIAILFSGNGSNLENIITHFRQDSVLSELESSGICANFSLGVCNKKEAFGITRCQTLGLKCEILPHSDFALRNDFDNALSKILRDRNINLVILAGFMRILGGEFVREFRTINIHPSFLPLHKGATAIKDSYDSSEDFGGVSVHWVSEELDSGEIICQEKLPKIPSESLQDFENRIHALEYVLYPKAIKTALINAKQWL